MGILYPSGFISILKMYKKVLEGILYSFFKICSQSPKLIEVLLFLFFP